MGYGSEATCSTRRLAAHRGWGFRQKPWIYSKLHDREVEQGTRICDTMKRLYEELPSIEVKLSSGLCCGLNPS